MSALESIGSVIPMQIVDGGGSIVEEIICASISGGADSHEGMPRRLTLMRFKDGKRIGWAEYLLSEIIKDEESEVLPGDGNQDQQS